MQAWLTDADIRNVAHVLRPTLLRCIAETRTREKVADYLDTIGAPQAAMAIRDGDKHIERGK